MFMRAQTAGPVAVGFEGNLLVDFTAVAALLGTGITILSASVALSPQSSGLTVIASTVDPSGTKVAIRVSATSAGSAQITVTPTYNDPAQTVDPRTITVNIVNTLG